MTQENRLLLHAPALSRIERQYAHLPLMERAGAAALPIALDMQRGLAAPPLILAGPGNNGGDALVLARLLRQRGLAPRVVCRADPAKMPVDARHAYQAWRDAGGEVLTDIPGGNNGLVVDGLFGIGLNRPAEGPYVQWIAGINQYPGPILSLDVPSGLNADTGEVLGTAVHATATVTFIAGKPGLYTLDGPDHCGAITVATLGLPQEAFPADHGLLLDAESGYRHFQHVLQPRRRNSHKGSYGSAGIIGGAPGMAGAALLTGRACLSLGAGRVYVGMLDPIPVDPVQPELMLRPAETIFDLASVLTIGPGLGASPEALLLLRRAIDVDKPLVIDADGLNLLAAHPALHRHVARRSAPTLLTPHPLEAARLLDESLHGLQGDRIATARRLARQFKADVVLKGVGSVLANAEGQWAINATGNPGLASAGTGDVLCGFLTALLAQGLPPTTALRLAVHLHGLAADHCVTHGGGPAGLTASELIRPARAQFNRWQATAGNP